MGAHRELPALGARLLTLRAARLLATASATLAIAALGSEPAGAATFARAPVAAVAALAPVPAPAPAPAPAEQALWSPPAALAACAAVGAPRVLFPDVAPDDASGPGAIVWAAGSSCPGGSGARIDEVLTGQPPAAPLRPRGTAATPLPPLSVASAPHGQIAISGTDPRDSSRELLVQGKAGGTFKRLSGGSSLRPPGVLSTAYLGDLALVAPEQGEGAGQLSLTIERWFSDVLGPVRAAGGPVHGAVSALTVAMDFRSDAIVAWAQEGSVWVRDLPAGGAPRPARRLGPAGSSPHLSALLSDDNRAIVIWSQQQGTTTSTWMDYSQTGPRFGAARLLERVEDPDASSPPAGSPQLIRLSSESVMSAWAGAANGHWVVRTAPIDQHGLRSISTIAAPDADMLLDALAPGPRGEAIALLGEPRPDAGQPLAGAPQALLAARGVELAGRTAFGSLEQIAAPAALSGATVGIEPDTDRALAVWQGPGGAVYYSLRAPDPAG